MFVIKRDQEQYGKSHWGLFTQKGMPVDGLSYAATLAGQNTQGTIKQYIF